MKRVKWYLEEHLCFELRFASLLYFGNLGCCLPCIGRFLSDSEVKNDVLSGNMVFPKAMGGATHTCCFSFLLLFYLFESLDLPYLMAVGLCVWLTPNFLLICIS